MGFIDHDDAVGRKGGVSLQFLQENSVRHDDNFGIGRCFIYKPHLVTNQTWYLGSVLFCDKPGDRYSCNSSRLCNADSPLLSKSGVKENFWNLSRLAGPRRRFHNNNLIILNSLYDCSPVSVNGKVFYIYHCSINLYTEIYSGSCSHLCVNMLDESLFHEHFCLIP